MQIFLDAENGTWLTIGPTVITWFNELCSQSEPSLLNTAANIPRGRQAEKEEFQHSLQGQKHFQKTYEMMKKSCLLIGCQWSSCPVSRVHLVQWKDECGIVYNAQTYVNSFIRVKRLFRTSAIFLTFSSMLCLVNEMYSRLKTLGWICLRYSEYFSSSPYLSL